MKVIVFLIFIVIELFSQELKIKADSFKADEKRGVSIFEGSVNIVKGFDELNASKVTIFTDKKHKPIKFIAQGDVSFKIKTKKKALYRGKAQKVIYVPKQKEYKFFGNVHLLQVDKKKEIIGDEVVLQVVDAKAYAKGKKSEPVIMIFDIAEDK